MQVRTIIAFAAAGFAATVFAQGNITMHPPAPPPPKPAPITGAPDGFVYVDEAVPGIVVDARYFGTNNFVGAKIDGYEAPRAIISEEAAAALRAANESLAPLFGLKVFDAYRPQQAVDHFARWAKDAADQKTKEKYYPDVAKEELFARGFIAEKSGHTRGSTVDLTVIRLKDGAELDMGTPFDFFGEESAAAYPGITDQQRQHRLLLQSAMKAHGFVPYEAEWWHFTLDNEPYPDTYFNFPVK